MKKKMNLWTIVLTVVITALIVGGGICFWQNSKFFSNGEKSRLNYVSYVSKQQEFSIEIPETFSVVESGDGLRIIQKLMSDDVSFSPEATISWDTGWTLDLESHPGESKILKEESTSINGIKGKKYIVSYQWLPEGNKYTRYRLEGNGIVYDMGLLDNFDPEIFENIAHSFRIPSK